MLYIMLQLDLCAHKIHLCLSEEEDISALLIQDSFLSLLLIMISIVANLKYCPAIISVLSLVTYFVCYFLTQTPALLNFLPVYLVVLVGVILYDTYAMRGAQLLEAENFHLKEELADFIVDKLDRSILVIVNTKNAVKMIYDEYHKVQFFLMYL